MIYTILRILFLSILPFSVFAQPIFVQSGEHADFSRLVMQIPDGKNWSLEKAEGKAILHIKSHRAGFDISRIFNFIPRDRVKHIDANQNQLSILFDCACEVTAFSTEGDHVVIDITSAAGNSNGKTASIASVRPPSLPKPLRNDAKKLRSAVIDQSELPIGPRASLLPIEVSSLTDAQTNLLLQLGSATTRGILEPAYTHPLAERPQIDINVFEDISESQELESLLDTGRKTENIRISTSMDVPKHVSSTHETLLDTGIVCPADDVLNVADWGDNRAFNVQISEARLKLFGEFDRLNNGAAVTLAQLYLYFGFGAEARQVLNLKTTSSRKYQFLFDMAEIMDSGHIVPPNSLQTFVECGGNISLWSILANPSLNHVNIDPAPALLTLNKLPTHLRKFIAPMLSDVFLLRGDSTSAATAFRSIERLPETLTPAAKMTQAIINLDKGNVAKGTIQLEGITNDNAIHSPRALVTLINTKLQSDEAIKPETIELVGAYAHELRNAEVGFDLRQAHVRSLAHSGQYDRAMSELQLIMSETKDKQTVGMWEYILKELTEKASDIVFLDISLQQSFADLADVNVELKMALASRLLELGFLENAQDIVQSIPDQPMNETRQILAAKIALSLGQPLQAQAELIGLDNEATKIIRADAKQMSGAHEEAYVLYQDAKHPSKAAQSAWLAKSWRELIVPEMPILGDVAALSNPKNLASEGPVGMLDRTEAALVESASTRQTLSDLLTARNLLH